MIFLKRVLLLIVAMIVLMGCQPGSQPLNLEETSPNIEIITSVELDDDIQFAMVQEQLLIVVTQRQGLIFDISSLQQIRSTSFGENVWFTTYFLRDNLLIFFDDNDHFFVWDIEKNVFEKIVPRNNFSIHPLIYMVEDQIVITELVGTHMFIEVYKMADGEVNFEWDTSNSMIRSPTFIDQCPNVLSADPADLCIVGDGNVLLGLFLEHQYLKELWFLEPTIYQDSYTIDSQILTVSSHTNDPQVRVQDFVDLELWEFPLECTDGWNKLAKFESTVLIATTCDGSLYSVDVSNSPIFTKFDVNIGQGISEIYFQDAEYAYVMDSDAVVSEISLVEQKITNQYKIFSDVDLELVRNEKILHKMNQTFVITIENNLIQFEVD